jgi:hypothetical protein
VSKRQKNEGAWRLPTRWLDRLALFLVLVLLTLYSGALLTHVLGEANFYVTPEASLYQMATSIFGLVAWVTAIVVVAVALQRGHPVAVEPWRRWPWISRGVAVLAAAAVLKHTAILVSWASQPAAAHLETVTLLLRAAGWVVIALGLLRGEEPLSEVLKGRLMRKDEG